MEILQSNHLQLEIYFNAMMKNSLIIPDIFIFQKLLQVLHVYEDWQWVKEDSIKNTKINRSLSTGLQQALDQAQNAYCSSTKMYQINLS